MKLLGLVCGGLIVYIAARCFELRGANRSLKQTVAALTLLGGHVEETVKTRLRPSDFVLIDRSLLELVPDGPEN